MIMSAIVPRVPQCLLLFLSCCTAQVTDTQPGCVDGDVRLVGGPNEFEGRVEIYLDGLWGQVCGRGWQRSNSEVVCRQLGYIREQRGKAEASIGSRYGAASSPYVVSTVTCTGSETRLENCSYTRLNITSTIATCNFGFNALAVCTDPMCFDSPQSVRLAGGDAMNEGQVEVCTEDGFRAALCAQGWNDRSAQTVCRELGLLQNGEPVLVDGNSTSRYFKFLNVSCSGMEESLSMCQSEIATSSELGCLPAASVVCPETTSTTTTATTTTAASSELGCNPAAGVICSGPSLLYSVQYYSQHRHTSRSIPLPIAHTQPSDIAVSPSPLRIPSAPPPSTEMRPSIILGSTVGVLVVFVGLLLILLLFFFFRKKEKRLTKDNENYAHANASNITNEHGVNPTSIVSSKNKAYGIVQRDPASRLVDTGYENNDEYLCEPQYERVADTGYEVNDEHGLQYETVADTGYENIDEHGLQCETVTDASYENDDEHGLQCETMVDTDFEEQ